MEPSPLQLQDIVPAEPLLQQPGWPLWMWICAIIGLIAGIILLFLVIQRRDSRPAASGPSAEAAYREAVDQLDHAAELPAREAATITSGAIRYYLSRVCGDPSLFETHEEFLSRHKALESYPEDVRDKTSTLFCQLARLKYDKDSVGERTAIIGNGRSLLETLHQNCQA